MTCRKKPFAAQQLRQRVADGIMDEDRRKVIQDMRAMARREKLRLMMLDRYRKQHEASWEPIRASALMSLRQLRQPDIIPIEISIWESNMRRLINEAGAKVRERMCMEDANPGWRFWYDFDPEVAAAARQLVKEYPDVPGYSCPLIIL